MLRLFGATVLGLALFGACSENTGPPPPEEERLMVSDSATIRSAALAQHRSPTGAAYSVAAQITEEETEVAYVSLPPESYDGATLARIRSPRINGALTALMIEGGLDPVAVPATVGHSIEIEILGSGGVRLAGIGGRVPERRRPRVVRTVPPRGKTDVAVNAVIVAVFSEPVAANSVSSSVQLFRGTTAVAGTARLLEGVTAAVVFEPSQPLDANTQYRFVVRPEVRDLDGDQLEEEVAVEFTSGSTFAPGVSQLIVLPDITALSVGSRLQLVARAFGGDDTTRVPVPIEGVPLLWSSENAAVASVTTTGLVTAVAPGQTHIRAQVLTNTAVMGTAVIEVGTVAPVASLELSPPSDTVPVTGKIELTAVTRDAAGTVVPFQPVSWSTSNSSIATVDQGTSGKAWVTGVSSGTISIVASSQGHSDTTTIDVVSPGPYQVVSAGISGACGLRGLWAFCWGENATGKVGDGSANSWMLPRAVSRGLRFVQISMGGGITCAITATGEAYCWGANALGALGIGDTSGPEQCEFAGPCSRTPVPVTGGLSFSEIRVSGHDATTYHFACGLTPNGAAYCWGSNRAGTLGIGTATGPESCTEPGWPPVACSTRPVEISGGHVFTLLTLGDFHACGLTAAGEAYCWGENLYGQLGDGTETNRSTPALVIGGLQFVSLTAGARHTCGLTPDGRAYCWGYSGFGALGHGSFEGPDFCQNPDPFGRPFPCSTAPERVAGDLGLAAIAAGGTHTCALTSTGSAFCWGGNNSGQLGNATTTNSALPVAVLGGLSFANLSLGRDHTCGVTTNSLAYCWGFNGNFALGTDDQLPGTGVPVPVEGQP